MADNFDLSALVDGTWAGQLFSMSAFFIPRTVVRNVRNIWRRRQVALSATQLSFMITLGVLFYFIPELLPFVYNVLYGFLHGGLSQMFPEATYPNTPAACRQMAYLLSLAIGMTGAGITAPPLFSLITRLRFGTWDIYENEITLEDEQKLLREGYEAEDILEVLSTLDRMIRLFSDDKTIKEELETARRSFRGGNPALYLLAYEKYKKFLKEEPEEAENPSQHADALSKLLAENQTEAFSVFRKPRSAILTYFQMQAQNQLNAPPSNPDVEVKLTIEESVREFRESMQKLEAIEAKKEAKKTLRRK